MQSKRIAIVFLALLMVPLVLASQVTAISISPAGSVDGMMDFPTSFQVSGANISSTYSIEVNDAEVASAIAPATDGSFSFSVTPTAEGRNKIEVIDDFDDSVVLTVYIQATDLIGLIIKLMVVIITITIILNIAKEMENIV